MIAAVYDAWRADVDAGKSSLMIGADAGTVAELNRLARADRVTAGAVSEDGVRIADGQTAGVGDEVFTRQNDRRLAAGSGWVKNGDRWVVTAAHTDGTMAVRPVSGGAEVTLPAGYVAKHVELAYATTAFRGQGRTVDTAHAMVSPTTTREVLYVAATRGRESNRLYVDVAFDPDPATGHDGAAMPQTARDVLAHVLANEGRSCPHTKLSLALSASRTTLPRSPPSTRRSPASPSRNAGMHSSIAAASVLAPSRK